VRWLVLIALLATPAWADFVVEEPGMYYACPKGKTWDDVKKCLEKNGRPLVIKQLAGAKIVRLDQLENGKWFDAGIYIYVEQAKQWKIAGSFFGRGTEYELLDFKPLTIFNHTGYRLDIGQATPLYVQLDGLTTRPATRRTYSTLFCSPNNKYCTQATRLCEVLVYGKAYWTFRGDMKINGNEVTITGDRKIAGPFCGQAERVFLGWMSP